MNNSVIRKVWDASASMVLALVLLVLLMVEVLLCTFAQKSMGTLEAVNLFMRSWFVWWTPSGGAPALPVFPGGALVGLLLGLNLLAATTKRLDFSKRRLSLWIVHAGLILLFVGEFLTGAFQEDCRMAIDEGGSANYVENGHVYELAVVDVTDAHRDDQHTVPAGLLEENPFVDLGGTPLTVKVHEYLPNALFMKRAPDDPPSPATAGVGPMVSVRAAGGVRDVTKDTPAVFVEPLAGARSYGVWLLSPALGAPQQFTHEGRTYTLALRPQRDYLPYSLTLKKFRHDKYAGTDIPMNFSSLVHVSNAATHEERDVLISMNQPLRYEGRAFYQASFGKGDTMTVLQVVRNPGWLIPYISCVLVSLGLVLHFWPKLAKSRRVARAKEAKS